MNALLKLSLTLGFLALTFPAQANMAMYNAQLNKDPNNDQVRVLRGNAYVQQGQLQRALHDYNMSIQSNPNNYAAYKRRGMLYERMQNNNKAIADYTRLMDLNPRHPDGYMQRAALFLRQSSRTQNAAQRYKLMGQALNDYNSLTRMNPTFAKAHFYRGWIYLVRKDVDTAFQNFSEAIKNDPKLMPAYHHRAAIYASRKDYAGYIQDLNQLVLLSPMSKKSMYQFERGKAYLNTGLYEQAIQDFEAVVRMDPGDTEARQNMQLAMQRLSNLKAKLNQQLAQDNMPQADGPTGSQGPQYTEGNTGKDAPAGGSAGNNPAPPATP